ncbi:hypothetical protein HPMG_00885 [Helicobacter pullorum MIT 98-5489]|uniref:Uncharacterized protein n=1 Tax=Helicobacter pullorum MIT 98-5489 TaxID=537972 RepID=C5EYT0_9HELI|nr:hypothetical protein HPMG_00885 [Helicobacter pullorum MIT 98-5489]
MQNILFSHLSRIPTCFGSRILLNLLCFQTLIFASEYLFWAKVLVDCKKHKNKITLR